MYVDYIFFLDELSFALNLITDLFSYFFFSLSFLEIPLSRFFILCFLDPMPFYNSLLHFGRALSISFLRQNGYGVKF